MSAEGFSIYTIGGSKVSSGTSGKPYLEEDAAQRDVDRRNKSAEDLGIKTRYKIGPGFVSKQS